MLQAFNNLTEFASNSSGHRVLRRSPVTAPRLISRLQHFKDAVQREHPPIIVAFITIPTASFVKFRESRQLFSPILTTEQLKACQHDLDNQLDAVNLFIRCFNHQPQDNFNIRKYVFFMFKLFLHFCRLKGAFIQTVVHLSDT